MAYIGQEPVNTFSPVPSKDSFTGDGSTTTFDLQNPVVNGGENALEVFVNNVRQEPGSGKAFTLGVDGSNEIKRITFTAAPANGAAIYVINDKTSNVSTVSPVDLNGVEFILDLDADTSLTADTDDRIDFKLAGTDHIQLGTSSGDTTIKIATDAKDLQFLQADGNKIFEINDGNFVGVGGNSAAPGEIRIFEDTDNGSHYTGFKAGNNTESVAYVLPTADGSAGTQLTTDGSGTLSWSAATLALGNDGNNRITTGTGSGGINAEANLTFDGSALQVTGTLTVGVNDTGHDVIFHGDTASANVTFDASADDLIFNGAAGLIVPDGQLTLGSTAVTATAAEINLLDTASANSVVNSKVVVYGSSGELAGTLSTAAQTNVTSLGTLSALTVDDVAVDGKVVTMTGSSSDTAVFTAGTNGTLSIVTTDAAAAAANITITADGTFEADGTTITLDSSGDIVLDADGGDVTLKDAGTQYANFQNTSGNLIIESGSTTAATFSGANVTLAGTVGSGAITSTGLITSGAGLVIADAGNIGSASDTDAIAIGADGDVTLTQDLELQHDGAILSFGAGDDVSLTHTNDVGITLNSTMKLMFNDASQYIQGASATVLDIAATDEIELTATLIEVVGNATVSGTLGVTGVTTSNAGVVVDNITIDGTEIDLSSGDLTLDVAGDIILDADGGDFKFSDGGTQILNIANSSSDVVVKPTVDTKDLIFQQYDGTEVFRVEDGAYMSLAAMAVNPEATLTDASTISWNSLTSPVAKVTLGANRTIGAATGAVAGTFASLLVIQDGTGSRTLTWNAAYEFAADTAPTLTTTASKGDLFVFRYNGAKWLEVGRNLALTLS